MKFSILEPEVAGELGPTTVLDNSVHPPIVSKLEYRFSGWLGDDLLECFPCFIVTETLRNLLITSPLSGFSFDDMTISLSDEFKDRYPDKHIPKFFWLKINGRAYYDDWGLSEEHSLVVSQRALDVMRMVQIENCDIDG